MDAMIISFLISVLSGMGVGGGGLFVIYLSVFTSMPQLAAQGMNLLFFLFSSFSSVAVQLTRRNIRFAAVTFMAAFGVIGALGGAYLTRFLPEEYLRKIFGIMLVAGGILAFRKSFPKNKKDAGDTKDTSSFPLKKEK